jgi:hypothetical protein
VSVSSIPHSSGLTSHLAKTIQKHLKDVGTDLVANLSVLSEFSVHASQLAAWCGAIRADLVVGELSASLAQAIDDTDSSAPLQSLRAEWAAIKSNTMKYHKTVRKQ